MTSSGQTHPDYQTQHASGYQNTNHSHQMLAQNTPPLDVIGTPNLDGFEFPYSFGENMVTPVELNASDPFNLATTIEHRDSISSVPPMHRNRYGSISGPTARHRSFSVGSEEASPTNSRMMGVFRQGDEPFVDDLKINAEGPRDSSEDKKKDKNESAPAWTELKTKAGKERKRLPLACTACRRKKIRCSGEKPACANCTRSKIPCVYKVTTKKATPRTDYMAMLDKRVKRMESRIINVLPKEEQNGTPTVARATVKPPIPGTLPSKTTAGKKRPAKEAFGPELDYWSKSVSKPSKENSSSALKTRGLQAQEEAEGTLMKEGADKLPSREIQEHLSEVFFEKIYGQTYHLLHKPSFIAKLKADALPPVLVLAVCACAARFSTQVELNTGQPFLRGEEWASEAREIVLKRYDWPNITILTCLLILGFHEFGTCRGGRSWALAGQAIRMAYALQLHKDLDHDPLSPAIDEKGNPAKLSFINREIRRRTMWACFLMDRFESSGSGRPTFIEEENLDIQLPVKEFMFLHDIPGPTENLRGEIARPSTPSSLELADPKQNMGVAAYVIRSIAIYSDVVKYFNPGNSESDSFPMWHPESKYMRLVKQLKDFQAAMPKNMVYNNENIHAHSSEGLANQFIFLYIIISQTTLSLNRLAVPCVEPGGRLSNAPVDFVTTMTSNAMQAADRIAELITDGQPYSLTAPFVGYCAFTASTILVYGALSKNSNLDKKCSANLKITLSYLKEMKKAWGMLHWMAEKLKEHYRTTAERVAARSMGGLITDFPQYGDWFDQFPHGVSQSDFEDPAAVTKKEKKDDAVLEQKSNLSTVANYFKDFTSPKQRSSSKPPRQKVKRTQSSSQASRPPQQSDSSQNMPSNMQPLHREMQVSTPSSSHSQISSQQALQQAPQNSYNQNVMSPSSLWPPPQYSSHHELLMTSQQSHNMGQQQHDRSLGFNSYAGMNHSAINDNGMHGSNMNNNVMNDSGTPGANHNGNASGMNWPELGMGAMGNAYDMMNIENGWFPPFNMSPPEIPMDGAMNGDDAFGGNTYGGDFEMRIGGQGMIGMDMSVNGGSGIGGI